MTVLIDAEIDCTAADAALVYKRGCVTSLGHTVGDGVPNNVLNYSNF